MQLMVQAAQQAIQGGPQAVRQFMTAQGFPQSGAWCGEFAAAIVHSTGGTPPSHPELASNWRNYGTPTNTPHPGDVAIRIGHSSNDPSNRVGTGEAGSHVTFVGGVDPRTGTFTGVGGNQGANRYQPTTVGHYPIGGFEFRTPPGANNAEPSNQTPPSDVAPGMGTSSYQAQPTMADYTGPTGISPTPTPIPGAEQAQGPYGYNLTMSTPDPNADYSNVSLAASNWSLHPDLTGVDSNLNPTSYSTPYSGLSDPSNSVAPGVDIGSYGGPFGSGSVPDWGAPLPSSEGLNTNYGGMSQGGLYGTSNYDTPSYTGGLSGYSNNNGSDFTGGSYLPTYNDYGAQYDSQSSYQFDPSAYGSMSTPLPYDSGQMSQGGDYGVGGYGSGTYNSPDYSQAYGDPWATPDLSGGEGLPSVPYYAPYTAPEASQGDPWAYPAYADPQQPSVAPEINYGSGPFISNVPVGPTPQEVQAASNTISQMGNSGAAGGYQTTPGVWGGGNFATDFSGSLLSSLLPGGAGGSGYGTAFSDHNENTAQGYNAATDTTAPPVPFMSLWK